MSKRIANVFPSQMALTTYKGKKKGAEKGAWRRRRGGKEERGAAGGWVGVRGERGGGECVEREGGVGE
jgi:hypothetical protein